MERTFSKSACECLEKCLLDVQNGEQTLELRIPDEYADVGQVLAAWGQPVLRSKEWTPERIGAACAMMVWVLYAPEDGSQACCLEGWIPFQMYWDIPQTPRDGTIRLSMQPRFVDARATGPRKLMVRAGLSVQAEGYVPGEVQLFTPDAMPKTVQLQRRRYPVRLIKEAGEKPFRLTEELSLPGSAPKPEKLLYYTLNPEVSDEKVIGNKVVFRGNGNLHVLYRSEEGQLHTWDFPLAFSQYGQLEASAGSDAQPDVHVCVTELELNLDDEGHMQLRAGLSGQYLVEEMSIQEVVADAYCPGRAIQLQSSQLDLPVILDSQMQTLCGQQQVAGAVNIVVDAQLLTGFPLRQSRADGNHLIFGHQLQLLCYGEDGDLQPITAKWESQLKCDEASSRSVIQMKGLREPRVLPGNNVLDVQWELPVQMMTLGNSAIPMVTDLELGEKLPCDMDAPSLILRRASGNDLWQIAKETGSTIDAIRSANSLQDMPAPNQLLLIPLACTEAME